MKRSNVVSGSKLNAPRAEIKARRDERELLIRGVFPGRGSEPAINVDELTAAIAQALREALK